MRGSSRRPLLDSNRILSLLRISSTIISVDGSGSALQLALDYCQLMSTMVVLKRRGNLDLSISPEASFVSQLSDETSIDRTSRKSSTMVGENGHIGLVGAGIRGLGAPPALRRAC